jgi:hypothetical protein
MLEWITAQENGKIFALISKELSMDLVDIKLSLEIMKLN